LAFARAASVVDARNVPAGESAAKELYFVYFSNKISGGRLRVLANKERLVIG
jgi:hypothetical protein